MAKVLTVAQQKGGAGKTTLAINLAVQFSLSGHRVALLDTDPQGSLGRWFMTRRERLGTPDMEFSTASAWGVGYETEKLRKTNDVIIIDTPPKIDSDLRPALREADLILIPVSSSMLDLWATDGVIEMAERVGKPALVVLNRCTAGTRLAAEIAAAAKALTARVADTRIGQRVAYAETLGHGRGVAEAGSSLAQKEIAALAEELLIRLPYRAP